MSIIEYKIFSTPEFIRSDKNIAINLFNRLEKFSYKSKIKELNNMLFFKINR